MEKDKNWKDSEEKENQTERKKKEKKHKKMCRLTKKLQIYKDKKSCC